MNPLADNNIAQHCARPAADTPANLELARRLAILADPKFDADCANSAAPVVRKLLLWGIVATAAWLFMMLQVQ
jgi:hypothetical protein